MLSQTEIEAYSLRLIYCPHCGHDGKFKTQGLSLHTVCSGCGHVSVKRYADKTGAQRLIDEWSKGSPHPVLDLPTDAPIIVNYGAGVDSTGVLVAMANRSLRPDLILFADVGDERPETYAYLDYFDRWLQRQGFPGITRVAYEPDSAPYRTLEGNCLANETLPSISISGKGSCTLKFKAAVMDRFLLGVHRGKVSRRCPGWTPALESIAAGRPPYKIIGYDAGPADTCRFQKASTQKKRKDPFRYLYPLQQLGWTREDCILAIMDAGLAVPIKSSCFFCLGTKPWEIFWLAADHPELLLRAIHLEDVARLGKHGFKTTRGLWRRASWRTWCEEQGIISPGSLSVIADREDLRCRARELKPPLESNLDFSLTERRQEQAA